MNLLSRFAELSLSLARESAGGGQARAPGVRRPEGRRPSRRLLVCRVLLAPDKSATLGGSSSASYSSKRELFKRELFKRSAARQAGKAPETRKSRCSKIVYGPVALSIGSTLA
jgi:hypothetical protein